MKAQEGPTFMRLEVVATEEDMDVVWEPEEGVTCCEMNQILKDEPWDMVEEMNHHKGPSIVCGVEEEIIFL